MHLVLSRVQDSSAKFQGFFQQITYYFAYSLLVAVLAKYLVMANWCVTSSCSNSIHYHTITTVFLVLCELNSTMMGDSACEYDFYLINVVFT